MSKTNNPNQIGIEECRELFSIISDINDAAHNLRDIARPMFNGIRYVSDTELSRRLSVTKRTLANYRANGLFGYYLVEGKILYAEPDIEDFLKDRYVPPFQ